MAFTAQAPRPTLAWSFDGTTGPYIGSVSSTTQRGTLNYTTPGKYISSLNIQNPTGTTSNSINWNFGTTYSIDSGFSFSFWIRFNDLSYLVSIQQFITFYNGTSNALRFQLNTLSAMQLQLTDSVNTKTTAIFTPTTGTWYHLTFVGSSGNMTAYLNGSTVYGPTAYVQSGITFNNASLGLATSFNGQPVTNADYDDLRVYNTALTAAQVQTIYAAQGMPGRGNTINTRVYSPGYITSATGGNTIVDFGGYRIHTFTTTGSSTFIPSTSGLVDVLVVAGGGGGGGNDGGGGSGGQVQYSSSFSISGAISVTVGSGGTAGSASGVGGVGGASSFGSISSIGGGGGGAGFTGVAGNASAYGGGSGGSNTVNGTVAGPTGTVSYKGGDGFSSTTFGQHSGGGGGGAGGSGINASSNQGGNGGPGLYYSISGYNTGYGGGGGGGVYISLSSPSNGKGTEGGGNGGYYLTGQVQGTDGTPNTGGGGGSGADGGSQGRVGGSGIVIVRYPIPSLATGTPLFSQLSRAVTSSAACAFSLRAVNGSTTRAVQVKRQSDSASQDFYADRLGNLLTVPVTGQTLENWLGGSTGNILTWYDQSGSGNHATQATDVNQPVIQKASKGPGYACVFNANQFFTGMSYTVLNNTKYSFAVVERRQASTEMYSITSGNALKDAGLHLGYKSSTIARFGQWTDDLDINPYTAYNPTNEPLHYWIGSESSTSGRYLYDKTYGTVTSNPSMTALLNSTSGNLSIGSMPFAGVPKFTGEIYEILIFKTSLYDLDNTGGLITQIYNNQSSYTGS